MSMPNFFIVGFAKAGTTSLYAYLRQHPQVYMPALKEPHYFSLVGPRFGRQHAVEVVSDSASYLALFEAASDFPAVGEASTSYLGLEDTAERIYDQIPHARIIILLRDPVERAYSHYLMDVREGTQNLSFHDAVVREREDPGLGWGLWHRYTEPLYPKVKRYLDVFGPEQVLILLTEDLKRDPRGTTGAVVGFLGLDPSPVAEIDFSTSHNPYAAPRNNLARTVMANDAIRLVGKRIAPKSVLALARRKLLFKEQEKPVIDGRTLSILREVYADDVDRLETLVGRPLPELRRAWDPKTQGVGE